MAVEVAPDRASGADLLNLALDAGPVPMQVGAGLVLAADPQPDPARVRRLIAERVLLIPRLRQRLVPQPPGCGRPLWIDDPAFDIDRHLTIRACPPPGDESALLNLAAEVIGKPLPRSRPLWSMTLVTGLDHQRLGLIACFHHVLADGMGGLAALAGLMDPDPATPPPGPPRPFPQPAPPARRAAMDARAARLCALAGLPHFRTTLRQATRGLGKPPKAARSSLNRPVGGPQRLAMVTADLAAVRRFAHAHGGTVNDAILAAVTGALRTLPQTRGETVQALVAQVPVSSRATADATRLGNQVAFMPIRLPTGGTAGQRLERTAAITRARKHTTSGASAELVAAVNRILAWLRIGHWLLDHQHVVNTAVTNLRGPERQEISSAARRASIPTCAGMVAAVCVIAPIAITSRGSSTSRAGSSGSPGLAAGHRAPRRWTE